MIEGKQKKQKRKLVVLELWLAATWVLFEGFVELCWHSNIGLDKGFMHPMLSDVFCGCIL